MIYIQDDCGGYCCHDYKLFIELTTNYMQQMVQTLQSEQAKRIDVKPGKKLMRKAAQEQAEARLVLYINCNNSEFSILR